MTIERVRELRRALALDPENQSIERAMIAAAQRLGWEKVENWRRWLGDKVEVIWLPCVYSGIFTSHLIKRFTPKRHYAQPLCGGRIHIHNRFYRFKPFSSVNAVSCERCQQRPLYRLLTGGYTSENQLKFELEKSNNTLLNHIRCCWMLSARNPLVHSQWRLQTAAELVDWHMNEMRHSRAEA